MAEDNNATAKEEETANPDAQSPAKKKKRKLSKSSAPQLKIREMIEEAITETQDRNGSSLQAIKKFLSVNFGKTNHNTYIRNALKKGVENGDFIQLKGAGASGSFKLNTSGPKAKVVADKTKRQIDSDKARLEKDAKSEMAAQRIAKQAKKVKKEKRELQKSSVSVISPSKKANKKKSKKVPVTPSVKSPVKSHKKGDKKKRSDKKSSKALGKKGSKSKSKK